MSDFIKYFIKKSDLQNSEFYPYKKTRPNSNNIENKNIVTYKKLDFPTAYNYCILDFETTGLDANKNNITEIGCIKVRENCIIDKFTTLVNPKEFIPKFISEKTGITNEMVKNKKDINELLPILLDFIDNNILVIHNAPFDMKFLITASNRLNISIKNEVIDTLALSRKFFPKLKKHNLEFLSKSFDINLVNVHRALNDALATFELYKIIQDEYLNN